MFILTLFAQIWGGPEKGRFLRIDEKNETRILRSENFDVVRCVEIFVAGNWAVCVRVASIRLKSKLYNTRETICLSSTPLIEKVRLCRKDCAPERSRKRTVTPHLAV